MRRLLVVTGIVLGSVACSGSDGLQLRSEVRLVREFPAVTVECLRESLCPQYVAPVVMDVAREGNTVALLYSWRVVLDAALGVTSVNNGVVVSRDGGETWADVDFSVPGIGGSDPALDAGAHGIAIRDGEIYVVFPTPPMSALGAALDWQQVSHLDTGGSGGEGGYINDPWLIDAPTSAHPGVFGYDYWGPSVAFASRADEWDLRDVSSLGHHEGTLTFPPDQRPCPGLIPWRWSPDGRGTVHLYGSCHRTDGLTCMGHATLLDGWEPRFSCVPDADWPVPAELRVTERTIVPTATYASVLFTEQRGGVPFTRAARITGSTASAVDIGPGTPLFTPDDAGFDQARPSATPPMHRRWGDLVALREDLAEERTQVTLYRVAGTGFAATTLPTRPCPDGASCGFRALDPVNVSSFAPSLLVWALPMGDDDYLLFYVLDQRPDMQHVRNAIYVAREHLDRGPGGSSGIERSCARAQTCTTDGIDAVSCARRWARVEYTAAEVAAFESAATCDALYAADPTLRTGSPCAEDGESCDGDVALSCLGGRLGRVLDCGHVGGSCAIGGDGLAGCVQAECPAMAGSCDGSGRALACGSVGIQDCAGSGLECVVGAAGPACVAPDTDCTGISAGDPTCSGTISSRCQASGSLAFLDCARVGLGCEASLNECEGGGACDEASYFARCEGTHLRYCLFGSVRDVDCGTLAARCSTDPIPHCAPTTALPDAAVVMPDAGPPGCGGATLQGPALPEVAQADYPTPTGGTIDDGTYVLTSYELWSTGVQPYTHRETLVVHGTTFERIQEHSALGVSTATGTLEVSGTDVTLTADCPVAMSETHRFIASGTTLVLLQSGTIRTFTRM